MRAGRRRESPDAKKLSICDITRSEMREISKRDREETRTRAHVRARSVSLDYVYPLRVCVCVCVCFIHVKHERYVPFAGSECRAQKGQRAFRVE